MSCPDIETLSAFADHESPPMERRAVLAHLSLCRACGRRVRVIAACAAAVRRAPRPEMPRSLHLELLRSARSIARKHDRAEAGSPRAGRLASAGWPMRPLWRPAFGLAAAASAALVLWCAPRLFPPRVEVPLELLMTAHNRYALTMPLAPSETLLSAMGGLTGQEESDSGVY